MAPTDDGVMRHQAWLGELLNNDRNAADSTCDLVLESEGKQFKVHKSVLMLVSNYFRRMFTIEMKEKYEGIVKMQKIPHQRLANIIQFIYFGQIEITEEKILDVLDDAEYTEIEVLKAKCSAFLLNVVSADNCLKLRAYAQRYNLDDLSNKANKSISKNFEAVVQHEDFKQLSVDDVYFILENRNKAWEETVFTRIVKWINHNPVQRGDLFVNLFSKLDLSLMSVDFLNEVHEENLVQNNLVCLNLLAKALLKMSKKMDGEIRSNEFILVGGEGTEQDCVVYDVITKQTRQRPNLQEQRCKASLVKVGSKVYAIGGSITEQGYNPHKSCEVLDRNEQTEWVAIPDMSKARCNSAAGAIQNHIFVTGGKTGKSRSSCEKFDIHNKKWSNIQDMLHARENHKTVVCNGGYDGRKRLKTVEKYDSKINGWKMVASLNVARSAPSACVIGNKIFVVGGWDGINKWNSVEMYDPILDVWTIAFETQNPSFKATVVAI